MSSLADGYGGYADLASAQAEGTDYRVHVRPFAGSSIAVTSVSRGVSEGTAIACRPHSTPVALVSSQMPTTSRIAPTATVRPNWPQVARPVWISE